MGSARCRRLFCRRPFCQTGEQCRDILVSMATVSSSCSERTTSIPISRYHFTLWLLRKPAKPGFRVAPPDFASYGNRFTRPLFQPKSLEWAMILPSFYLKTPFLFTYFYTLYGCIESVDGKVEVGRIYFQSYPVWSHKSALKLSFMGVD